MKTMRYLKMTKMMFLLLFCSIASAQNELDVIKNTWLEYTDASNFLYHYITKQAYSFLDKRENQISGLQTLSDWKQRQDFIRKTLFDIVGPFPEKSPLNANVASIIDKGSFRVENIIFESRPGFYVTSSLFIPSGLKRNSKTPAIIYCSGHSGDGYRSAVYQHVILNLVSKKFIVFAFDPVGQGERLEYYDPVKKTTFMGGPTKEHSYPGAQAFLTGSSQARYMIWDGIRAVDYLLTRKEIDPLRIGITGRSGGGTQSAFIAAMDDRIYAAAPENYLTNYKRLLQSIGPQDAEQNMFNIISNGLDHPDFLIVRAPRPALMVTTSGDMFSIQGVLETRKEVSRIYDAYGKSENFSRVEDDAGHASTLKNREAMYAFFQKYLNNPGNAADEDIDPLTGDELKITPTGQVSTSLKGETVFSMNYRDAVGLNDNLDKLRQDPESFIPEVIAAARKLSGYHDPSMTDEPVFTGRIVRDKYKIEKFFVKGEGDYVLPYLMFRPAGKTAKYMIYLNPDGKAGSSVSGGEIEKFVLQGYTVLAPDILGIGELGPGGLKGDAYFGNVSHNMWYASMLIGRSLAGIRAGDVVKLASLIRKEMPEAEITGYVKGDLAPVLLHSAAFSREIGSLILEKPCLSYLSIATTRLYDPLLIMNSVPGALTKYDLPDLAGAIAPRKLTIVNPVGADSKQLASPDTDKDLQVIKSYYHFRAAENKLKIISGQNQDEIFSSLISF